MNTNHEAIQNKLKRVSTATIATALFKRGLRNQFIQNVSPIHEVKVTMVGRAFTLRYIPAREDLNPISVFQDPKHPQRVAFETCPEEFVLVIDSRKNARAASAGSILIKRLMIRGANGVVTDGGFRDTQDIKQLNFPSYHKQPSAPTNLTLHQAIDINVPIACGDVAVFPGDYIVGDHDGVMVIPADIVEDIADECLNMTLFENFVIGQVEKGQSIIGLYPPTNPETQDAFNIWLKANT
ncbi:ribonuclease activity regulator RraA [Hanstruepera ponticola]|uniref:ribonuclease activity regulator RraA n=1 Tax=Hanstruepera ponticola TaxID=2042995 RepID=UPI000CF1BB2B|nr:ribonuclease activity regulator RraA [Hanstruepera ponticola]